MKTLCVSTRLLIALTLCAAFTLALSSCAAPENANQTGAPAGNTNATTTTTTTTTAPPAATPHAATSPAATAAPAGDKIGVEECDDYLAKYEACLNSKVPEAGRAQLKSAFDQTRKSWQGLAATPQGKQGLATACKAARDAAKQSMAAYGCTF
ncbi:MAG TPA: hypothetical protein VF546_16375 [Pyrinomonadaceae bacterium]|jgi:hypothetical protein